MSDILSIVKGRRTVRQYLDKEVPDELLNKILEAVRFSPSWNNSQCWEVIVIKDMEIRKDLQKAYNSGNPAGKALTKVPVVIALCGKLKTAGYFHGKVSSQLGDWVMFDLGLAAQTICLTAHGLGLATVIGGGINDHKLAKEILKVPEEYVLSALIPLGYAANEPRPPKRREIKKFTHYDVF